MFFRSPRKKSDKTSEFWDTLVAKLAGDPLSVFEMSADMEESRRRKQWLRQRFWHNGPHANCCPKCLQAGYVMALVNVNRLDLLGEYPELVGVYEELLRDGMLATGAG